MFDVCITILDGYLDVYLNVKEIYLNDTDLVIRFETKTIVIPTSCVLDIKLNVGAGAAV